MSDYRRPAGITALSIFFLFGACMSGISALLLLFPGSIMDGGNAHNDASSGMASLSLLLMTVICAACIAAAAGLWRFKLWGFWTALILLGANILADFADLFSSHNWRTLIGLPIAGVLIWYLLRQRPLFEGSVPEALPQS